MGNQTGGSTDEGGGETERIRDKTDELVHALPLSVCRSNQVVVSPE